MFSRLYIKFSDYNDTHFYRNYGEKGTILYLSNTVKLSSFKNVTIDNNTSIRGSLIEVHSGNIAIEALRYIKYFFHDCK